jgi:hypothetical protein
MPKKNLVKKIHDSIVKPVEDATGKAGKWFHKNIFVEMPKPTKKGKGKKGKSGAQRAAAAAGAKAGKKAAKKAVGNRRPKRGKPNNRQPKAFKGNRYGRPAGTQAKRGFSMDHAVFKGRDYVSSLVMTGNDASTALEGPGQVIYKVQLQPWKLVSNGRLARCMALFEKWRPRKLTFRLRSSQPPGLNGGTVLMVYEPKVNEKMPDVTIGSHTPDRAALSRYENHTNAKILQMNPNKGQKDGNTDFSVNTSLQIGPYGGWFNYDSDGTSTLAESSSGQVMIMIQQPMNCRGSSGVYSSASGTGGIDWADLILDYEVECSVANDEPVADGPAAVTSAQGQVVIATSGSYATQGFNTSSGYAPFLANYNSSDWAAAYDGFPQTTTAKQVQFSVASGLMRFIIPMASGYGLLAILKMKLAALADAGTTRAGYQAAACQTVDQSGAQAGTVYTAGVTNVTNMPANQTILFLCPAARDSTLNDDFYEIDPGSWTTGTGGSSTASTTGALADWYFFEIPSEWQESQLPALHQSLLKLLERSGEHVPESELKQLFPKKEQKHADWVGDRTPLPFEEKKEVPKRPAAINSKLMDKEDDWDTPDEKELSLFDPKHRYYVYEEDVRSQRSDRDEVKARAQGSSRPSSLKSSSGGKDKS